MNVRVDAIRPMKGGGAVIRTPSIAEAKGLYLNIVPRCCTEDCGASEVC